MPTCIVCKGEYSETDTQCVKCGVDNGNWQHERDRGGLEEFGDFFLSNKWGRLALGLLILLLLLALTSILLPAAGAVRIVREKLQPIISVPIGLTLAFILCFVILLFTYALRFSAREYELLRQVRKGWQPSLALMALLAFTMALIIAALAVVFVLEARELEARKLEARKLEALYLEALDLAGKLEALDLEALYLEALDLAGKLEALDLEALDLEARDLVGKLEARDLEALDLEALYLEARDLAGKLEALDLARKLEAGDLEALDLEARDLARKLEALDLEALDLEARDLVRKLEALYLARKLEALYRGALDELPPIGELTKALITASFSLTFVNVTLSAMLMSIRSFIRRLNERVPQPIFLQGDLLVGVVINSAQECLGGGTTLSLVEMSRTDRRGIRALVEDRVREKQWELEADAWGRLLSIKVPKTW
jgi:hypothetical protein